jgi:hypothetical protein
MPRNSQVRLSIVTPLKVECLPLIMERVLEHATPETEVAP